MFFDFSTFDSKGKRRYLVEAKLRRGPRINAEWAAATRGNWMSQGELPVADGLLLVLPERLFFWPSSAVGGAPPKQDINAGPLLAPYFARLGVTPDQVGAAAFEGLVRWWLEDLTQQRPLAWTDELKRSGLVEALAGQEVLSENAA